MGLTREGFSNRAWNTVAAGSRVVTLECLREAPAWRDPHTGPGTIGEGKEVD